MFRISRSSLSIWYTFSKDEHTCPSQAQVHSIVEFQNYVTQLNLFKNDMSIPILNFLFLTKFKYNKNNNNFYVNDYKSLILKK